MPVESFIEDPRSDQPIMYRRYNLPNSGHVYTSYPNGLGNFTAILVGRTSDTTASVYEIEDGATLELSLDPKSLPDGATRVEVTPEAPYEKDLVSPEGHEGKLIVRYIGDTAL